MSSGYYDFSSAFSNLNQSLAGLGKQFDEDRKRQGLAELGQQIQTGNYDGAAQKAFASGDAATGLGILKLSQAAKEKALEQEASRSFMGMLGTGAPQAAAAAPSGGYFATTRTAESSGDDAAKNPNSTATGRYQFLEGTWNGLMRSNPELGLTADGRGDPQQQERAVRAFTAQNATALKGKGIEPNDRNLYMAHFLGAGAAPNFISAVQQDPTVPAASLVSPNVAAANRGVFFNQDGSPRSAGEVYERMTARYGGGSTAVAALSGGGGQPVQVAQAQGGPQADLPAQGAANAQGYVIPPGQNPDIPPNDPAPRVSNQALMAAQANPNLPQAQRDMAKGILDRRLRYSDENSPIKTQNMRLQNEKLQRDLNGVLTPEQEAQKIRLAQAGRTQINNTNTYDAKGETKFNEALGTAQAKRWNGYIEEGDLAQNRLADIQTLRETSRRLGSQGSQANLKSMIGPYAESLGIKVDGLSDIQLYESITNRLAPQLRAPGSGSTSDIEFKGFMRAIGPLSNTPAAREMILDTFEAASRNDIARSEIASRLAAGEINRGQAEREIRALPNPLEGFREFRKQNPDLVGQAIKEAGMRNSAERRDPVKVASPDEARKLPSGTRIILPDGRPGQVP